VISLNIKEFYHIELSSEELFINFRSVGMISFFSLYHLTLLLALICNSPQSQDGVKNGMNKNFRAFKDALKT